MLEVYYWFKGILVGLIISIPMGPVGIMCIQKVVSRGVIHGYAAGIGASIADGLYAGVAAFGLTFAINFLMREEMWLRLIGGIFLIVLGIYWFRKPKAYQLNVNHQESGHLGQTLTSAFFLNFANPINLLIYLAMFSAFGLTNASQHFLAACSLVVGVLIGVAGWRLVLIEITALFRKKITPHSLRVLNNITAVLVILFGLFLLATLIFHLKIFGENF